MPDESRRFAFDLFAHGSFKNGLARLGRTRMVTSLVTPDDVPVADQVWDNSDPLDPVFLGYDDQGTVQRWLAEGSIGNEETESYGILDLRVKYVFEFGENLSTELFLDVFNVLDNQAARRSQDLASGGDGFSFIASAQRKPVHLAVLDQASAPDR